MILCSMMLISQNTDNFPFRNPKLPINERIDDLISRLTLEEKLGMLEHQAPGVERLGISPYNWWNEALHGVARNGLATVFPQPIALAATFDDKAVEETFSVVSDEARAKFNISKKAGRYDVGLSFFTPNINIFRDPRWGRGMETYGEDPFLTGKIGVACVKGLQGDDKTYFKTIACAKHFAVHSGPEHFRHEFDAEVSARDLWTTYLPAFETLIKDANVQSVMCAYNSLYGEPCCTNDNLLINILRNKWHFDNILVTDCWALNDCWERDTLIPRHETHATAAETAADAFSSSVDLECGSGYQALVDAVNQNFLPISIVDSHLHRILREQFRLGLYDPDSLIPFSSYAENIIDNQIHKDKALEMAEKSIVLLENKGVLPIGSRFTKIAVIGPNAYDSVMQWGNYNGTPSKTVTILEGIYNYMSGQQPFDIHNDDTLILLPSGKSLYYNKCCDHVKGEYVLQSDFYDNIKKSDVVIFVGGISPSLEGEQLGIKLDGFMDGDRTIIELPKVQDEMLQYLRMTGKKIILVLCNGSAISLDWEKKCSDAIVEMWYGGQAGGTAVANVLFGNYNPAGRLPVTFYKSTSQIPPFKDYNMKGRTYKFMTEKPTYPFGYGLSYSTFAYKKFSFDKKSSMVSVNVQNTGNYDGDEVVQVYLNNPNDPSGPVKTLVGFKRVFIKARQTVEVEIPIDLKSFYSFDDNIEAFVMRHGHFSLYCGGSSDESSLHKITVKM